MNIKIAYLYYDLLNLYGENGNVKVLINNLKKQNIETTLYLLSTNDELNFDDYDLVYIGAGTQNNQKIALKHLINYKDQIKCAIENNKHFLITGNSIELFGSNLTSTELHEGLSIFDYETIITNKSKASDAIFKSDLFDEPFIGFQNQFSYIKHFKEPFFKVIKGLNTYNDTDGVNYKNFFGTYLLGPILARNPHFLEYFIKNLLLSKDKNFKFNNFDLDIEKKAYKTFIKNFYDNFSN